MLWMLVLALLIAELVARAKRANGVRGAHLRDPFAWALGSAGDPLAYTPFDPRLP